MFLAKNIIGIDVSDTDIKLVQLDENKTLLASTECSYDAGVVTDGNIVNVAAFVTACQSALLKIKTKDEKSLFGAPEGIVSLPEGQAWTYTVSIPDTVKQSERIAFVQQAAEKMIPHDLSTFYSRISLEEVRGQAVGIFVAASKKLVDTLYQALNQAGVRVSFIGSNFYSIARAVLPNEFGDSNYVIVDIGDKLTTIGVFDERAVPYAVISSQQYADTPESQGKILADIRELESFFNQATGQTVTHVVVTGRRDDLTAVVKWLSEQIKLEVMVGDPFMYVTGTTEKSLAFANCIGLALYGVDRTLPHINVLPDKKPKTLRGQQPRLVWLAAKVASLKNKITINKLVPSFGRKEIAIVAFTFLALIGLVYVLISYL